MKYVLVLTLLLSAALSAQSEFEKYFTDKTLRFDYYETGNKDTEMFSFAQCKEEKYWGGSKTILIDTVNYGNYQFVVKDYRTGEPIYSRGYSTLFQEWQTTEEAKTITKTFSGTVTFPYPKDLVVVELYKRDKKNNFTKRYQQIIDPASYFIKKEHNYSFPNIEVHKAGDPAVCYDIVLLPEGYTKDEMSQFHEKCKQFAEALFEYEPFNEYKNKINIWGVEAVSAESGSDIPADTIWKTTILNSNFYTFDSERYIMTEDYFRVRDVAANAPYDQIYILANTEKYGGGAIFNFYSLTAANNPMANTIFVHELGHGLAGLADEYYTSDVSYQDFYPLDVEPWEPNITTLVNFESKWKDMLDPETPVPTDASVKENYSVLGVYEGGGYVEKGVYRPTVNSIMKALRPDGYNAVSIRAIKLVLDQYTK